MDSGVGRRFSRGISGDDSCTDNADNQTLHGSCYPSCSKGGCVYDSSVRFDLSRHHRVVEELFRRRGVALSSGEQHPLTTQLGVDTELTKSGGSGRNEELPSHEAHGSFGATWSLAKQKVPSDVSPSISCDDSTTRQSGVDYNSSAGSYSRSFDGHRVSDNGTRNVAGVVGKPLELACSGGNEAKGAGVLSVRGVLDHLDAPGVGSGVTQAISPMLGDKRSERPAAPPRRSRGLFALFCTVERDRFAIFASLFKRYRLLLDPFVERVVGPHLALYPNLVNMLEFLRNPSGAPGGCFFDYPLLAWPFNVLYTASCFYVTARLHGYHRLFSALSSRGGLLASGKDVLGALAVAMSPTEEALIRNTSVMYHAAFFAGSVYLENESCLESHVHKCTNRSFALLVVNITISSLKLLVDEVNQIRLSSSKASRSPGTEGVSNVIPLSHVEIARVLGNRCAIVSGNPIDLERLDVLLVRYAWTVGIKIRKEFLSIFTPENSFYYNQSRHLQLLQLWLDNGVELDASSLHLTLYSPVDGTPWSNGTMCNFMDLVARTVTYSPHDLSRSLRHLSSGDVLLDFTASDLCAGQLIELGDCSVTVLSEPGDVVVSTILSTPKRGSIKHVMESSFAKCAIINDILQSMHWEGKPPSARIDELSGTFVHFGLLARGSSTRRPFSSRQQSWHESRQRKHDRGPGHMFSAAVSPECCLALDEGPCHGAAEYVVVPNERIPAVVDLYQISPVIRNYEIQSGCVLTAAGVEFMRRLLLCTRLPFPPHTLLMCPSVLDLIYLWETYEFLRGRGVGDSG